MKSVKEFCADMEKDATEALHKAAEEAAERTIVAVKAMGFNEAQIAVGKAGAHFRAASDMLAHAVKARNVAAIAEAAEQLTAAFLTAAELAAVAYKLDASEFMRVVNAIETTSKAESGKLAAMLSGEDAPTLH